MLCSMDQDLLLTILLILVSSSASQVAEECGSDGLTFEVATGYVFSAPDQIIDTRSDTLHLADCIQICIRNNSCSAINFETGLCVLFKTSADKLPGTLTRSHFPVFTIYAQKICLSRAAQICKGRPWAFETVPKFHLTTFIRERRRVASRKACMELCLQERNFQCRSASYNAKRGECALSDMDRFSITSKTAFENDDDVQYFESNCIDDPVKMCEFQRIDGRILKTVDAVYQDVVDLEVCKSLCLSANFRCHSFDYEQTGDRVCRLSHHSASSLTQIQEAYLEITNTSTHELSSCFNVSVDCRATDMLVKVQTNRLFGGKVYSKNRPHSCVTDVVRDLKFELRLGYNDIDCEVETDGPGRFFSEIVIQHHDQIVTSQDLGLVLRCTYELKNYTLSSGLDLSVASRIPTAATESTVVPPPRVSMRITRRDGGDASVAQVGDPLSLRFEIEDRNSPYEIFVRELIAFDGTDNTEIVLIDPSGCPTDQDIMGPVMKVEGSNKILQVPFDAFKFPTSDVVQFKALVTPCLPRCDPVKCLVQDFFGFQRKIESLGRRRRRQSTTQEDLLVAQTIRIEDKFQLENPGTRIDSTRPGSSTEAQGTRKNPAGCQDLLGLLISGAILIIAQIALIAVWILFRNKRNKSSRIDPRADFTNSVYRRN